MYAFAMMIIFFVNLKVFYYTWYAFKKQFLAVCSHLVWVCLFLVSELLVACFPSNIRELEHKQRNEKTHLERQNQEERLAQSNYIYIIAH